MKRFYAVVCLSAVLVGGLLVANRVAAATEPDMTATLIAQIRLNCVQAQNTLTQLNASDALLRVNQGEIYEQISSQLMAPLNSRIALNHLNGAVLLTTAARYENELDTFRQAYQNYADSLQATLAINCTNQPVTFYDSVVSTREKRVIVYQSVGKLNGFLTQFKVQFDDFTKQLSSTGASS